MNANTLATARRCMQAAHDGSMDFPAIVGALIDAGFEGYTVDYRAGTQAYYHGDGHCAALPMADCGGPVGEQFDVVALQDLIGWAQSGRADYSYPAFSRQAKAAGCAGYLVSFPGRRAVYFGRTAEVHVELFP